MSKKSSRDMSYKEEVNSAQLNGKDIVINGKNDVTLEASKLNAKDNLIVNAQNGDLNILAKEYKESELHMTSKSSFGGLSKSLDLNSSDNVKLNSANLQTTGSNIVLTSGKDINVIASNISSGKDIQINATNNLNVLSQTELSNKENVHEKSSFNLAGLTSLVGGNQSISKIYIIMIIPKKQM